MGLRPLATAIEREALMAFAENYNDVASRIREFAEKYPEGRLRPVNPDEPFRVVEVVGHTFIAYAAAAYRDPDDALPGVGVAWEPFPGKTNFTRDSELQNAETSAWGRAIVAALAADTHKGIATSEDVRNRQDGEPTSPPTTNSRNCPSCGDSLAGNPVVREHGVYFHKACLENPPDSGRPFEEAEQPGELPMPPTPGVTHPVRKRDGSTPREGATA
jgi:hypothetical protein